MFVWTVKPLYNFFCIISTGWIRMDKHTTSRSKNILYEKSDNTAQKQLVSVCFATSTQAVYMHFCLCKTSVLLLDCWCREKNGSRNNDLSSIQKTHYFCTVCNLKLLHQPVQQQDSELTVCEGN